MVNVFTFYHLPVDVSVMFPANFSWNSIEQAFILELELGKVENNS
jgi:hypothetical protein